MSHHVTAIAFGERSRAFGALSELKGAGFEGHVDVLSAAVVERDADDLLSVPDGADNVGGAGTTAERSCGSPRTRTGRRHNQKRAGDSTLLLDAASAAIPAGGTAPFAEVEESAEQIVDGLAAALAGSSAGAPQKRSGRARDRAACFRRRPPGGRQGRAPGEEGREEGRDQAGPHRA